VNADEVLGVLRETGALLEGHFELRSGLHSDQFFQCANVLRLPRVAERLCAALVGKLGPALGGSAPPDVVIAPALGGIIVGHEVARALNVPSIFAEKQDGALVLRRFSLSPGDRVVVAEDVVTRGGRVQETIDIVREAGAEVVAVALLVDRSGGKASFGVPTVSLLEMEPVTWEPEECPSVRYASRASLRPTRGPEPGV
jgi:orotate phosphoribosyltransferase